MDHGVPNFMSGQSWDSDPETDLFGVLTQDLFVPEEYLPEVNQYLTQTPHEFFDFDNPPLDHQAKEREEKLLEAEEIQHDYGKQDTARFGPCVSSSEIAALQEAAVLLNTKNTSWAVNVWDDWSAYRKVEDPTDCPPFLFCCLIITLSVIITRFLSTDYALCALIN